MISVNNYNYETWGTYFSKNNFCVELQKLKIHNSWENFFNKKKIKKEFKKLNDFLSFCLKETSGKIKIYPYPELVFEAFNETMFNSVNVIILGQDPYFNNEIICGKEIPQAMGLSFSVPIGLKIPSSLCNIFKNQIKFGHINEMPNHGNLTFWAYQGCLMLNTVLTVQHGYKNSHQKKWEDFTNYLIEYLSRKKDKLIFVLWGSPALQKIKFVDKNKHKIIISSHPSGLSYNKPLGTFEPFCEVDHFGLINKYLKESKKETIIWQLPKI